MLCAVAQTPPQLIAARVLQGVAAALLTPGSLAIIESSFRREDRAGAIGSWAGVAGVTTALGPFVGGFLLDHGSWRLIFLINLPLCLAVLVLCRWVPESRAEGAPRPFDVRGALLCVVALGAITYALTVGRSNDPTVFWLAAAVGVAGMVGFVLVERHPGAMVPTELFASRIFTAANLMTLLVYGALGSVFFLLVLQLQVSSRVQPVPGGAGRAAGHGGHAAAVVAVRGAGRPHRSPAADDDRSAVLRRRGAAAGGRRRRHVVLDGRAARAWCSSPSASPAWCRP